MPLQNTFKEQRKLQNKYDKAFELINELPMSDQSRTVISGVLLDEFKSETKKIIDDKTDVSDEVEPETPPLHLVTIHDVVPPVTEEVSL
jgi:hypothetical protein